MTPRHDLDQQLTAFLRDGPEELPYESFDAVRDRTEQTSQRVVLGPWRTPTMNRSVMYGLGAAAVIIIALVAGTRIFGSRDGGFGAQATPTQQPSATTPTPRPTPSPTHFAYLSEGPFQLTGDNSIAGMPIVPMSVDISTPDWYGTPGDGILTKGDNPDPPDGAGMIVFSGDLFVYGDPCRWSGSRPDQPAKTVDQIIAGLQAQASRDASKPVNVTVDGHAGKAITLHVPDDAVFANCDAGTFGGWGLPGADQNPMRYYQGPGQINEVWVVDVDGVPVTIDIGYYDGTPRAVRDELRALAESITFE